VIYTAEGDRDWSSRKGKNQPKIESNPLREISQDLFDGEFSSILAAPFDFLPSLEDFIRPREKFRRECQSDLFRSLQVDDELKLRCLLDRKIAGLRAF
jgi:hypothetical protein